MRAGILGLKNSGKTTLLSSFMGGANNREVAVVTVPDVRVPRLQQIYNPRKTTYATVIIEDLPSIDSSVKTDKQKFSERTKTLEVQIFNIGGFLYENGEGIKGEVYKLRTELIINDLDLVLKRLERIEDEIKKFPKDKGKKEAEINLLNRIRIPLEEERFPHFLIKELTPEERSLINNYNFLTLRPSIYVLNLSREQFEKEKETIGMAVKKYLETLEDSSPVFTVDALTEAEIMQLPEEESREFLMEYGMEEPARNKVIRKIFQLLGLITFFTVGEDEVRAWNIPYGGSALDAAGTIHTDLAKGFIRAEVTSVEDLLELGSLPAVRSKGKLRLEGKTYPVKDGDIVHIMFNI